MKTAFTALALTLGACVTTPLTAQTTFTLPTANRTMATTGAFSIFAQPSIRVQQIYSEAKGRTIPVLRLSFRRASSPRQATSHTVTLTARLGQGNFNGMTTTFASNWIGTPTVGVNAQRLSLPDWSTVTTSYPAPFDLSIPLSQPWVYNGANDMMLEFQIDGTRQPYSPAAFAHYRTDGNHYAASRDVSTSCTNTISSLLVGTTQNGQSAQVLFRMHRGPTGQPASFILGTANPNLTLPGICTPLNATPNVVIPLGSLDSRGSSPRVMFNFPYDGSAAGTMLFGQAFAPDATGSAVLGQGIQLQLPTRVQGPVVARYLSASSSTATTGRAVTAGGLVIQGSL